MKYDLKTISGRKELLESMNLLKEFNNKIVLIGCGAIGTALIPLLLKLVKIEKSKITIIDMEKSRFENIKISGINFKNIKITKDNFKQILIHDLQLGQDDIIIDASYGINTTDMFNLCNEFGISYINSSIEVWSNESTLKPVDYTFYSRISSLQNIDKKITQKKNNFLVSMGCNPGNVNIWTLYALEIINKKTINYNWSLYNELAQKLGLCVVHISERDSQITSEPRKLYEYVNTWSSDAVSWYDEAFSFIELGWGTHEKTIPNNKNEELSNKYQIILNEKGCMRFAKSYTPINKNLMGMLIRHEECFTICKKLSIIDNLGLITYKPSCYYVYKCCDSAMISLNESKENDGEYQESYRLLTNDIIDGNNELGCTLFFSNNDIYWVGSLLNIEESRLVYNNEYNEIINATILQVVAGYIGGLLYLIESIESKIYRGLLLPEDLPIKKIIKWTKPLLGPFGVFKVKDWKINSKDSLNPLQFSDFTI